jgi:preprotein translocase subunit SecE
LAGHRDRQRGYGGGANLKTTTFKDDDMAKLTPGEFIRQVRTEGSKIVWPTSRETMATAIMVLIMTALLAVFFLGIDSLFGFIVNWLLSFAA